MKTKYSVIKLFAGTILFLALLTLAVAATGQTYTPVYQGVPKGATGFRGEVKVDSAFYPYAPYRATSTDTFLYLYGGRLYRGSVPTGGGGSGITSIGINVPSGFSVTGSPLTSNGSITISAPGNASTQYINGGGGASLVSGLPVSTATQTALNLKANQSALVDTAAAIRAAIGSGGGSLGSVTSFAFTNSTGITGTVANATTTPTLSLALTKAAVGLSNVDNTSDASKPVSTATQTALDGKVSITPWITKSTNATLINSETRVKVNAASANINITLPSAASCSGIEFVIKKTDASTHTVIVVGTVDGSTNYTLFNQYESITVSSDGTSFYIL